jgi:hypothetical protein
MCTYKRIHTVTVYTFNMFQYSICMHATSLGYLLRYQLVNQYQLFSRYQLFSFYQL